MRRALAAAALAALAAAPGARAAPVFHDAAADFSLDLSAPGAAICVIRPAALAEEEAEDACQGFDVAAVDRAMPANLQLVAVVRQGGWQYWLTAQVAPSPYRQPPTRVEATVFAGGLAVGARNTGYTLPDRDPELLVVNDLQVMRYRMSARDRSSPSAEIVNYTVVGRRHLVTVSFMTDVAHLEPLRAQAARTMATVRTPPVAVPARWTGPALTLDGVARGARVIGAVVLGLVGAGVLFLVGFLVLRRKAPARGPGALPPAAPPT